MKKKVGLGIVLVIIVLGCRKVEQNCNFDINEVNGLGFSDLNRFLNSPNEVNNLDTSIKQFKKVLGCDPLNSYAINYLTLCYLYKNEYDEALEINSKAINNLPLNTSFLKSRGEIYELMNNLDSSKYYFNKALVLNLSKEKNDNNNLDLKIDILFLLDKVGNKLMEREKLKEYIEDYPDNEVLKTINEIINK